LTEQQRDTAPPELLFSPAAAMVGAAAGATVGSVVPVVGTIIGAGIGGLLGAVGSLFSRLTWNEKRWLRHLEPLVHQTAMNLVLHGALHKNGARVAPVVEAVISHVHQYTDVYCGMVQDEVDNAIAMLQQEIDDLLAREEEIRRESESIIARLEPKVRMLTELRDGAGDWLRQRSAREAA
jgi:hypothetical protein